MRLYKKPAGRASLAAGLVACLTACATSLPYWDDRKWVAELYHAVQQGIYLPADLDPKIQYHDPTVQFTYADGTLQDAEVVKSSGSEVVDAAIKSEIAAIHVPAPPNPQNPEPHRFQMDVHIANALQAYQLALRRAISAAAHYPGGASYGKVLVSFDYAGQKLSKVTVKQTSGSSELDKEAVEAIMRASMPPTPAALADVTHFFVVICFGDGSYCGSSQTVIRVSDKTEAAPAGGS